jgi:phosphate transport system protein
MAEHLQREIARLRKMILREGTLVEESLRNAITALWERDLELAQLVISKDAEIDEMEVEVEEECLKALALYQPVASDLRYIIAVLKLNNDLERIGDLATNIAERVKRLVTEPVIAIPDLLPRMADTTGAMLKLSLDALVESNLETAIRVCDMDDEIDSYHRDFHQLVADIIPTDPKQVFGWLMLLSVSRQLERAADHCTNIAEDVQYMIKGKITRHRLG